MSEPKPMPSYWSLYQEVTHLNGWTDKLQAENDRLRDEIDKWHRLTAGIELPEYPITEFQPKDLERENAKLLELVRDIWSELDAATQYDAGGGRGIVYEFAARMKELGVDV